MAFRDVKSWIKFLALLFLLGAYFVYLTTKYDMATGGIVSLLTWSFFVLCTPIADGGFLIDFPLRLLFGIQMIVSELFVWALAIGANIVGMNFFVTEYDKTFLTSLLKKIIVTPYPYWAIIGLSCGGTFLSLWLGDQMVNNVENGEGSILKRLNWKPLVVKVLFFVVILVAYYHLLSALGVGF